MENPVSGATPSSHCICVVGAARIFKWLNERYQQYGCEDGYLTCYYAAEALGIDDSTSVLLIVEGGGFISSIEANLSIVQLTGRTRE